MAARPRALSIVIVFGTLWEKVKEKINKVNVYEKLLRSEKCKEIEELNGAILSGRAKSLGFVK